MRIPQRKTWAAVLFLTTVALGAKVVTGCGGEEGELAGQPGATAVVRQRLVETAGAKASVDALQARCVPAAVDAGGLLESDAAALLLGADAEVADAQAESPMVAKAALDADAGTMSRLLADASLDAAKGDAAKDDAGDANAGSVLARATTKRIEFETDGVRVTPILEAAERKVDVALAPKAGGRFSVQDVAHGMAVRVALQGVSNVDGEAADGHIVYRGAHSTGGDVIHRVSGSGTEDYVVVKAKGGRSEIVYDVALEGVAGLRQVEHVLEFLDPQGTPRLRMVAPEVRGAACEVVVPSVSVEGCNTARDRVVSPGASSCRVRVAWDDAAVTYPVVVDPTWSGVQLMSPGVEYPAFVSVPADVFRADGSLAFAKGDIIVAGGTTRPWNGGPYGEPTTSTQVYRWATNVWQVLAPLPVARQFHTLNVLGVAKDKLIVAGGSTGQLGSPGGYALYNTTPIYDMKTDTWSTPASVLANPRVSHRSASLSEVSVTDGRVVVTGGHSPPTDAIEAFDPATNTWGCIGRIRATRLHHVAVPLSDGRVFIAGGWNPSNGQYEGSSELASTAGIGPGACASKPLTVSGPVGLGLAWSAGIREPTGNVIVAGGEYGTVRTVAPYVQVYNFQAAPSTGSWTSGPSLPLARTAGGLALVGANGRVFFGGGWNYGPALDTFSWNYHLWRDTPTGNGWQYAPSLQYEGHEIPIVASVGNRTIVGAGAPNQYWYSENFDFCDEECNDGNLCTIDTCAPNGACVNTPKACADTNVCDGVETCNPATGACVDGTALPIGTPAPDDLPCNGIETCDGLGNTVPGVAASAEGLTCTLPGSCFAACDGQGSCVQKVASQPPGCGTIACVEGGIVASSGDGTCQMDGGLPGVATRPAPAGGPGSFHAGVQFLYTGVGALQTVPNAAIFDPIRAAVVRGRVLTATDVTTNPNTTVPLSGATVTVVGHPEFGSTTTRSDGWFDLAVNGGEMLTVRVSKTGYEYGDRKVTTTWHDFALTDDLVLVQKTAAQGIDGGVRSVVFDAGSPYEGNAVAPRRSVAVYVPAGTAVTGTLPDGGTWTGPSTFNVRVSEFTRGNVGPTAMPAPLPAMSRYTYAANFGITEADNANVTNVDFSTPVSVYLDNFANVAHGERVPVGTYDSARAMWQSTEGEGADAAAPRQPEGRVIRFLSTEVGTNRAILDVTAGDNSTPATAPELAALGITDAERVEIAKRFTPPRSIWRVRLRHFSNKDFNWPYRLKANAISPPNEKPSDSDTACQRTESASILGCDNQTLGEELPITGTPFALRYQSERTPGRIARIEVPITDNRDLPFTNGVSDITRVEVETMIAGQRLGTLKIAGQGLKKNMRVPVYWDRRDAYGQMVHRVANALVVLTYVYEPQPAEPSDFGSAPTPSGGGGISYGPGEIKITRVFNIKVNGIDATRNGLGGWAFNAVHMYDADSRTLIGGDGTVSSTRVGSPVPAKISTKYSQPTNMVQYADAEGLVVLPDLHVDAAGVMSPLPDPALAVAFHTEVVRIRPDGTKIRIAGTGNVGLSGNSGTSATLANLDMGAASSAMARGPDGSLYLALGNRIRRIKMVAAPPSEAWNIYDVAGGTPAVAGTLWSDGVNAPFALLGGAKSVAVGPDGSVYFQEELPSAPGNTGHTMRLRRVAPDGRVETLAGCALCTPGQGGGTPARIRGTSRVLNRITAISVDDSGDVYFGEYPQRIWRLGGDGYIEPVLGGSTSSGLKVDGLKALPTGPESYTYAGDISSIARGKDGLLYYSDVSGVVRAIRDGRVFTVAGKWTNNDATGDGGQATQAGLLTPAAIAFGPNETLYVAGAFQSVKGDVRAITPAFPGWIPGNMQVPSPDGKLVYEFDLNGQHLRTFDAMKLTELLKLTRDASGRVTLLETPKVGVAGYNAALTVVYGASTITLTSLHGRVTTLSLTSGKLTNIAYPTSPVENVQLTYAPPVGGKENWLLTQLIDPLGTPHKFLYDFSGRLVSDSIVYASGDERAITLQGVSSSTGGRFVRRKSPLGRTMIRHIERGAALGDVTERLSTTGEDGLITVSERKASGTSVVTTPDRTTVTTTVAADPRLGLSAPYASSVVTLNQIGDGGVDAAATVSLTETRERAAGWVSPALTSTTSVTDTVTFNGSAGTDVAGGGAPDVKSLTQIEALTNIQTAPTLSVTRGTLKRATVFDGAGRVTAVQVPGLHDVVMAYDTEGRLSTVTQSGRSTTFAYDAVTGYPTTVTVNPGAIITNVTSRDGVGRPKSITLPGGRVVDLGYNFAGRQFTVTPPGTKQSSAVAEQRPAHVFGVDAAGLLTAYTAPDIGATVPRVATHGWDKDKAPMGMFLPQPASLPARTTFVSYDEAGRVKALGHSATGSVAARTAEITYDAMGRPSVLTSKVGGSVTSTATTTYTSGLVTQVSTAITGATTVPIAYQYDGFMRVKTRTIGGAVPIASTWDSATGLLTATGGVGITRTGLVGGFQSGQLAGLTASGGRTYTVTYPVEPVTLKGYGEPQRLEAKFGATSKYSVTLGRDALGRITTRQEVNEGTPKNRFYVYDTAGRLWKVYDGVDGAGVLLATYTYDSNGNRTDQAYGYDLHDRQTFFGTASYAYTANGERTTRSTPAQTLTYDPQGQLVSVDAAGTVITYEIDGLGRRVRRTKNGVSERYLWDGARIAAVLDNAGAVLRRFVYATSGYVPDAILEGSAGTLYLVVKDERGSVRQLIDPAGAVAEKYEYDEWGKELPGAPVARKSLFGFAGGVYDQDTGLVRFGARDYDPAVGRWTTKDGSRFGGGTNFYEYAHSDAVNFRDPTGFAPEETGGREYGWSPADASAWNAGVGWAVEALNALTSIAGLGSAVKGLATLGSAAARASAIGRPISGAGLGAVCGGTAASEARALVAADLGLSGNGIQALQGSVVNAGSTRIISVANISATRGALAGEARGALSRILAAAHADGVRTLQIEASFANPSLQTFVAAQAELHGGTVVSVGGRDLVTFLLP